MSSILIVEDEFAVRENISILLTEEGYETLQAENGMEAYKILMKDPPDLIITDIVMPLMDGYELLQKLKDEKIHDNIPVILLTAKTERSSFRKGMNIGADDFITKPFSSDELLSAIKSRLRKTEIQMRIINDLKNNIMKYVPHELRTPLVPILGYSNIILENPVTKSNKELMEMVALIQKSGLRLSNLVEKLMLYAEIDAQVEFYNIDKEKLNYTCKIDDINWKQNFSNIKEWIDRKEKIQVNLESAEINVNPDHLSFLLKELVENGVKFSNSDTDIKVEGVKKESDYLLSVSDSGIGFNELDLKQIGPFKQFKREENQQNGIGLGLGIINRIVYLSGGEIDIKSKNNENTVVTISFPLSTNNIL